MKKSSYTSQFNFPPSVLFLTLNQLNLLSRQQPAMPLTNRGVSLFLVCAQESQGKNNCLFPNWSLLMSTRKDSRVSCSVWVQQDGRALSGTPGAKALLLCQPPARLCAAWAALLHSWDQAMSKEVHTMWTRALAVKPLGFKFLMFWTVI